MNRESVSLAVLGETLTHIRIVSVSIHIEESI